MNNKNKISFTDLKKNIQTFHDEVDDFSPEKYDALTKQISNIKDDLGLMILESEDRYQARLERRPELNEKIKEYNKTGPQKTNTQYIKDNAEEFYKRLIEKVGHMKDGDLHIKKLKRGSQIAHLIPVKFTPRALVTGDNYDHVRKQLEAKEKDTLSELTNLLETANEKSKNIYESYATPSELFEKLGIKIQKVNYSFFAQENGKTKGGRKIGGVQILGTYKEPSQEPKFKKIGYMIKYLLDNNIPFRADNILQDKDQRYQLYFYQHNITILISDMVTNSCFRDATYVIKGMVPGLKNINKEELRGFQGRKIVFNDTRPKRIEGIFSDDPENWEIIAEEREEQEEVQKTMITDRAKFIGIIKEYFTPETLTTIAYKKFAVVHNDLHGNDLLLNDTLYGNSSLLGLGGSRTIVDIKNAIFNSQKPKLELAKDSYFFNEHTKKTLIEIKECEGFDTEKTLGSCTYGSWVTELLRKACNEEFIDAVKNKSMKEKKEKIEEYTGIKNIPLYALKITTMLGGRTRSTDTEYQKMLRKRFMLHIEKKSASEEYTTLERKILEFEVVREDEALRPNTNKSERRGKKEEKETQNETQTTEKISNVSLQNLKKTQEKNQTKLIETLKGVDTIEKFPLFEIKNVRVMAETATYRVLKANNCPVELRLFKLNIEGEKRFSMGEKIEIFGVMKSTKDQYIKVKREKKKGYHKLSQFNKAHPDHLIRKYIPGEKYDAIVNNIQGKFVYVSLTKHFYGKITISQGMPYTIGDIVKVVFDKMPKDPEFQKIVTIH